MSAAASSPVPGRPVQRTSPAAHGTPAAANISSDSRWWNRPTSVSAQTTSGR
jgi:hypothetical protein